MMSEIFCFLDGYSGPEPASYFLKTQYGVVKEKLEAYVSELSQTGKLKSPGAKPGANNIWFVEIADEDGTLRRFGLFREKPENALIQSCLTAIRKQPSYPMAIAVQANKVAGGVEIFAMSYDPHGGTSASLNEIPFREELTHYVMSLDPTFIGTRLNFYLGIPENAEVTPIPASEKSSTPADVKEFVSKKITAAQSKIHKQTSRFSDHPFGPDLAKKVATRLRTESYCPVNGMASSCDGFAYDAASGVFCYTVFIEGEPTQSFKDFSDEASFTTWLASQSQRSLSEITSHASFGPSLVTGQSLSEWLRQAS